MRSSIIGILLFSLFSMAGCVPTNVSKGAKSENTSTAKAVTAVISQIVPSPVAIVLQVGQWMIAEDTKEEVFYVRVQASGLTESEARKEAFRLAVDQAVGSLLVAETEIRNEQLIRHDVINYSSGYIHDFEYVNVDRESGQVTLQIDVYVKKSKIAERISITSPSGSLVEGDRIHEAILSKSEAEREATRLLSLLLGQEQTFLETALGFNILKTEYIQSDYGRDQLKVSFEFFWHERSLIALEEGLREISEPVRSGRPGLGIIFSEGIFNDYCTSGWLCDDRRYVVSKGLYGETRSLVDRAFGDVTVYVELLDIHGQSLLGYCHPLENTGYGPRSRLKKPLWTKWTDAVIYPRRWLNDQFLVVDLSNVAIEDLRKVTLKVKAYSKSLCKRR